MKTAKSPKTGRGRRTQAKLLDAAEVEFGVRGFHEAAISGITQRAGVALGTFYVYFDSKEEIFRALVSHMGHLTRSWIAQRVSAAPDRVTAERLGLEAFIDFARRHKNLYRIVMEAQFVAADAYRHYYDSFVSGYRDNLKRAARAGEIRPGDDEARAWALIGMSVFLGMRYAVWDESTSVKEVAAAVGDFIAHGLTPTRDATSAKDKARP
ncbi:MAG: TetR/AcrR family transcriptional regulator [Pseudomonadota bacterium]